jgi:hypothetical protein
VPSRLFRYLSTMMATARLLTGYISPAMTTHMQAITRQVRTAMRHLSYSQCLAMVTSCLVPWRQAD